MYGTIAGFKAYADARGISYAGKTDPEITQALVRSSDYVDGAYRAAFIGYKTGGRDQTAEWPRAGAIDINGYGVPSDAVPVEVENAVYEGAVSELASPGSLSPDIEAGGGQLKREKIGPLEFEYERNGAATAVFRRIDDALAPLLGSPNAYVGVLSRA